MFVWPVTQRSTIYAGNQQDTIDWRVQTLRQLGPRIQHKDGLNANAKQMCEGTTKNCETAICALTVRYLHSDIRPLLLDPGRESVRNDLAKIVAKAAEISYLLWTQKIHLFPQTLGIGDTDEAYGHNDPLMDAREGLQATAVSAYQRYSR
jgi:hypothetical protein